AYVWLDADHPEQPQRVLGYFTLSGIAMARRQARRRDRDRFLGAYEPAPGVLIGRLALDVSLQGHGHGGGLMVAAMNQALKLQDLLGVVVVVVHAIDEIAARFYEHQGFERFRDEPLHLYYPLARFQAVMDTEME
ncbi:MAG: GNAT family N-acetyltransferase, partial [Thermomicrobiales bacterium]|nr:GNAT family N-acetyltransferase [Thermomicrobiales bacterium]